jgi:hypothetical protein
VGILVGILAGILVGLMLSMGTGRIVGDRIVGGRVVEGRIVVLTVGLVVGLCAGITLLDCFVGDAVGITTMFVVGNL